jgi:hypothetical protein
MTDTRHMNTGIMARGRIYVATDYKVYAFTLPVPAASVALNNLSVLPGGLFQFSFTNQPGLSFTILVSPDLSLPLSQWTSLGSATEVSPGQFQVTDPAAQTNQQRFYRVRSP